MEVNFSNNPAVPATPVEENASQTPVTQPAPTPPPAQPKPALPCCGVPATRPPSALAPGGLVLGDKLPDFSEIILPRVNISQNIGNLKESFLPGTLVLDRKTVLFIPPAVKDGNLVRAATPPVVITVLGFRPTRFCEKVVGGDRGLIVNTEAEVRAAGGTLDYSEWNLKKASGMKRFEPLADALVAVLRPATCPDDDTVFTYDVDGGKYALALWAMRGTSYTAAAKRVFFTARAVGCLRSGGYPSWRYTVATREDSYPGGNKAWVPVCLPKEKNSEAFLDFVRQVLNAPAAEAQDEAAE